MVLCSKKAPATMQDSVPRAPTEAPRIRFWGRGSLELTKRRRLQNLRNVGEAHLVGLNPAVGKSGIILALVVDVDRSQNTGEKSISE